VLSRRSIACACPIATHQPETCLPPARSFSIRRANGELVYDSASILDRQAHARGIYDDGRSRDKGVEPKA
jgi:hypothetical protein